MVLFETAVDELLCVMKSEPVILVFVEAGADSVPICVPLASSMLAENPIFELPAAATLRYT